MEKKQIYMYVFATPVVFLSDNCYLGWLTKDLLREKWYENSELLPGLEPWIREYN